MIGEAANRILKAAACFIRSGVSFQNVIPLLDRQVVEIGPFRVQPLLVDHSVYDAYSLLVEADGKRLFYTGDFRVHGRKAALVERLIEQPPVGVDVLLMEGTSIGRLGEDGDFPSEEDLEHEFVDLMQATRGTVLVYASGQNIDRLVTMFRACRKTGRELGDRSLHRRGAEGHLQRPDTSRLVEWRSGTGHGSFRLMDACNGPASTQKAAGLRSQQNPIAHAPRSASTETIQDPMGYSNRLHERFIPIPPNRPCGVEELFRPGATGPFPGGHHDSLRRRRASKVTTSFSAYSNCESKW
jgi:hypothetical protein